MGETKRLKCNNINYWWWNEGNSWNFKVSSHGSASWQQRGNISARRSSRRICSLEHVWGGSFLPLRPQDMRLLCEFGQTALTLAPIFASVDICGSVEGVRSSQSELFTSRTSKANWMKILPGWAVKGGGRYRSMGPHCLGLRVLRGQQRTHTCRNGIVFVVFLEFVTLGSGRG